MEENRRDLHLLHSDPNALLVKYQVTITTIVRRYVHSGMFTEAEIPDLVQSINVDLLSKMPILQMQFSGAAFLRTYLSCIIRHTCIRLWKEQDAREVRGTVDGSNGDEEQLWNTLSMQDAFRAYHEALTLYGQGRGKIVVLLKLFFRIPLEQGDLITAYPSGLPSEAEAVTARLGWDIVHKNERETFAAVADFMNKAEGKTTHPDGLRHRASEKAQEVVELLNARLPGASFTKKELGTLMESLYLRSEWSPTEQEAVAFDSRLAG